MNSRLRGLFSKLSIAALALTVIAPVWAQQETIDVSAIEAVVNEQMEAQNTPGIAVAVVHGGSVIYSSGFGVRNTETNDPVTADTLFQIGSTTKPLTSIGLLMLVEDGRVDLDAPVSTYLPEFQIGDDITVRQLLSHTAGLSDEAIPQGTRNPDALRDSIPTFTEEALFAPPGEVQSYSNPGFNIAGAIIEAVSGEYYADYMAHEVFPALGMDRTTFDANVAITYPVAAGYQQGMLSLEAVRPLSDNVAEYPSGFAYSSANDLVPLVNFILQDGVVDGTPVLSAELVEDMKTPVIPRVSGGMIYGLGLDIVEHQGRLTIGHGGNIDGYATYLNTVPELDLGVIVLANNIAFNAMPIFDAIVDLVDETPETTDTPETPYVPTNLQDYVGVYELASLKGEILFSVQVSVEDDYLKAEVTGQPAYTLRPTAPDVFELYMGDMALGAPAAFLRDDEGAIVYLSFGYRVMKPTE